MSIWHTLLLHTRHTLPTLWLLWILASSLRIFSINEATIWHCCPFSRRDASSSRSPSSYHNFNMNFDQNILIKPGSVFASNHWRETLLPVHISVPTAPYPFSAFVCVWATWNFFKQLQFIEATLIFDCSHVADVFLFLLDAHLHMHLWLPDLFVLQF